ncbi:MAG TPA: hypothetical protein DD389_03325, partial [Candidatus Marinimicrobia bacterium]|nr:hypothetical protein [Candidatus Neomarinimicrobiota bacterium]
MELIHPIFKWLHIIAGVLWIGLLYFFNWINGHFAATLDGDTKKKVVPELMPRALYFFRWGAAWTWVTGVVLLYVIFWQGSFVLGESGGMLTGDNEVSLWTHIMISAVFLAVFVYDFLYKSSLAGNVRLITIVSFALIGAMVYCMKFCAGFDYRAFNIHLGAMFGSIMA